MTDQQPQWEVIRDPATNKVVAEIDKSRYLLRLKKPWGMVQIDLLETLCLYEILHNVDTVKQQC
jgi:hypothetical protein